MNKLEIFINDLCGVFDNENQINQELESGKHVPVSYTHLTLPTNSLV